MLAMYPKHGDCQTDPVPTSMGESFQERQQQAAAASMCMMQDVADKKKEITDEDLLALITDEVNQPVTLWSLLDLQVSLPAPKPPLCFLICHADVTAPAACSPRLGCTCPELIMHILLIPDSIEIDRLHCSPDSAMKFVHSCMWHIH